MPRDNTDYYATSRWPDKQAYQLHLPKTYQLPVELTSYKDAADWWRRKAGQGWRGSNDRPVGKRDHRTRRMRMLPDKSIEFEYDSHVLCTWHPDNTLTVNPYDSNKTGAFAAYVLPDQIEVDLGARTGKLVYLKPDGDHIWSRIKVETDSGVKHMRNPDVHVVRGEFPVKLEFNKTLKRWWPVSEYQLKPFEWLELDKSELREVSKRFNFADFIRAIESAMQLGADISTKSAYSGVINAHSARTETGESILELLEQGRFVEAASFVRARDNRYYDHVQQKWVQESKGLNSTDIKKIRHLAYAELGVLYIETARIVTLPQYLNIETKLRDFGRP